MVGKMLCCDVWFEGGPYHDRTRKRVRFSPGGAILMKNPKSFMLPKLRYEDTGEKKEFRTQSYKVFRYIPNK